MANKSFMRAAGQPLSEQLTHSCDDISNDFVLQFRNQHQVTVGPTSASPATVSSEIEKDEYAGRGGSARKSSQDCRKWNR
jgi:hypothetical protein